MCSYSKAATRRLCHYKSKLQLLKDFAHYFSLLSHIQRQQFHINNLFVHVFVYTSEKKAATLFEVCCWISSSLFLCFDSVPLQCVVVRIAASFHALYNVYVSLSFSRAHVAPIHLWLPRNFVNWACIWLSIHWNAESNWSAESSRLNSVTVELGGCKYRRTNAYTTQHEYKHCNQELDFDGLFFRFALLYIFFALIQFLFLFSFSFVFLIYFSLLCNLLSLMRKHWMIFNVKQQNSDQFLFAEWNHLRRRITTKNINVNDLSRVFFRRSQKLFSILFTRRCRRRWYFRRAEEKKAKKHQMNWRNDVEKKKANLRSPHGISSRTI